jgi:CBS domain-containing protein
MNIRDLAKKAVLINETDTFREAVARMEKEQINSLLVIDEAGRLVGEIGVSDLLNAIVPDYLPPDDILTTLATESGFARAVKEAEHKLVSDFMTVDIQPVHVDDPLLTIASVAIAHGTQHIPVVDHDERPIGIISRRGLKHILAQQLGISTV